MLRHLALRDGFNFLCAPLSTQLDTQLGTKLRIGISYCQVIACLPLVLDLVFPPAFRGLTHLLGLLSLRTFGVECMGDFDYVDYMYGITLLCSAVLGVCLALYKKFDLARLVDSQAPDVEMQTKTQFQLKIATFAHMFLFLTLPAVSCAIFRMFPCQVSGWLCGPAPAPVVRELMGRSWGRITGTGCSSPLLGSNVHAW
jgi:hypothetical protein